ncbi:MAG: hypothetical protein HYY52_06760 [Candidatus Melainabacteria bacterium]|nr:hypothetical protein [Candidatus Melainabacteria bacterium]
MANTDGQDLLGRLDVHAFYKYFGLELRNSNTSFKCILPGHEDNNPSLSIRTADGVYNCFACGRRGDPIEFWKEMKGVPFKTAIQEIADLFHIKIKKQYKKEKTWTVKPLRLVDADLKRGAIAEWFEKKNITKPEYIIKKYPIKYCEENEALAIQIGKRWKLKALDDRGDRWDINSEEIINPQYLELDPPCGQKKLLLLEGFTNLWALDCVATDEFRKEFYVVISVHGVNSTHKINSPSFNFGLFDDVYLLFDSDQAGKDEMELIQQEYPDANGIVLDQQELRDWLKDNTFQTLYDLLTKTRSFNKRVNEAAWSYLRNPNMIDELLEDFSKLGIVGEKDNLVRLYLACISYKQESCLGVILKGASSSGKTKLVKTVTNLMPDGVVHSVTSQSEQALNYWTDISHKIIIITEERPPDDKFWEIASAWRQLVEDDEVTRMIVDSNEKDLTKKLKKLKVKGPIVYISTTTQSKLHEENENRLLIFNTDDSPDHVRNIVNQVLACEEMDEEERKFLIAKHRKAVELLEPIKYKNIKIPFNKEITFHSRNPEASRDVKKFLKLLRIVGYLYQYQLGTAWQSGRSTKQISENPQELTANSSCYSSPTAGISINLLVDHYDLVIKYFKDYFDANASDISKDLQNKWNQIYQFSGDDNIFTVDDAMKKWGLKDKRTRQLIKELLASNMITQVPKDDEMFDKKQAKKAQYRCVAWDLKGAGLNSIADTESSNEKTNSPPPQEEARSTKENLASNPAQDSSSSCYSTPTTKLENEYQDDDEPPTDPLERFKWEKVRELKKWIE